jgi:hypothetical protein
MDTQTTRHYEPMSSAAFAAYGMQEVAYVKAITVDEKVGYAIHAADGTPLTVAPNRDTALAIVRQNDLEPLSAH